MRPWVVLRSRKLERAPQGWGMTLISARGAMGTPAPWLWAGVNPQAGWLLMNKPVEANFENILSLPGPGAVEL